MRKKISGFKLIDHITKHIQVISKLVIICKTKCAAIFLTGELRERYFEVMNINIVGMAETAIDY